MSKMTMKELANCVRSRIDGMGIKGEKGALLKGLVTSMEIKYELDVPRWVSCAVCDYNGAELRV